MKPLIVDVILEVDRYGGEFKRKDKRGHWRKFASCGNAGVSLDIADILRKLGHVVEITELSMEDEG